MQDLFDDVIPQPEPEKNDIHKKHKKEKISLELKQDNVGSVMRECRKLKKMSQYELSKVIELHPSRISDIERDRTAINITTLLRIAKGLDLKIKVEMEIPDKNEM